MAVLGEGGGGRWEGSDHGETQTALKRRVAPSGANSRIPTDEGPKTDTNHIDEEVERRTEGIDRRSGSIDPADRHLVDGEVETAGQEKDLGIERETVDALDGEQSHRRIATEEFEAALRVSEIESEAKAGDLAGTPARQPADRRLLGFLAADRSPRADHDIGGVGGIDDRVDLSDRCR